MSEPRPISDYLVKAWGQALSTVSAAEDEASRWVQRWAGVAGLNPDEVRRHATEWAERLTGQRRQLERSVEEGVRNALHLLRLPKREEVQDLEKRLGQLTGRVEALQSGAHKKS